MKKLALFVGNCQAIGIMKFLINCPEFNQIYDCKFYANWEMIENKDILPINELRNCDLFIYQPLKKVFGCYSTDPTIDGSLGSLVKNSAIRISFPYVYNTAFWPIYETHTLEQRQRLNLIGWQGTYVIDKMFNDGMSEKDIIYSYDNNLINWDFENRFEQTFNILKEKEKITDLKITNYISDNLSKKRLFLTQQHPTSHIFIELSNNILDIIGLDKTEFNKLYFDLNHAVLPDSVYKHSDGKLPMSIFDKEFYAFEYDETSNYSFNFYKEIIKKYINGK